MSTPAPPPPGWQPPSGQPPGWQPAGPYVSPPANLGRTGGLTPPVNPDETVQLRFAPGGSPGWPPAHTPLPPPPPQQQSQVQPAALAPVEPEAEEPARTWWAFLPTLIWLAAAAFTVGALIALS